MAYIKYVKLYTWHPKQIVRAPMPYVCKLKKKKKAKLAKKT